MDLKVVLYYTWYRVSTSLRFVALPCAWWNPGDPPTLSSVLKHYNIKVTIWGKNIKLRKKSHSCHYRNPRNDNGLGCETMFFSCKSTLAYLPDIDQWLTLSLLDDSLFGLVIFLVLGKCT